MVISGCASTVGLWGLKDAVLAYGWRLNGRRCLRMLLGKGGTVYLVYFRIPHTQCLP